MTTAHRSIRTEAQYEAALREAAELMDSPAGTPEGERLEQIVALIESYEARHWRIDWADRTERIESERI